MKNMWICLGCGKEVETKIVQKEETLSVKGKLFTLLVNVRVCVDCGKEVIDEKLDGGTLRLFYDEYKNQNSCLQLKRLKKFSQSITFRNPPFLNCLALVKKQ